MSDDFTPINNSNNTNTDYEQRNYPEPKDGARRARVSLIVDLGIQERENIWKKGEAIVEPDTEGAVEHEQKPVQQVVVFADLVNDVVDYGGDVGKAHYRLMLNPVYAGVIKATNFSKSPPTDAKGKKTENKPWALHPNNLLTKLAKAVGKEDVIESAAINKLINLPFMATVEVKKTPSKDKKDEDGNPIVYTNVNFKGASKVAAIPTGEQDADGNHIEEVPKFAELKTPARCVTFSNATKDDIQFIRGNVLKMIKLANNYAGSNMQKAIEAFEAEKAASKPEGDSKEAEKPVAKKPAAKSPKKEVKPDFSDMDDDIPF
jgi:hypothetical protein